MLYLKHYISADVSLQLHCGHVRFQDIRSVSLAEMKGWYLVFHSGPSVVNILTLGLSVCIYVLHVQCALLCPFGVIFVGRRALS